MTSLSRSSLVALMMLVLAVSGCHSLPPPSADVHSKHGIPIYGDFVQEHIDHVDHALSFMEPAVIRSISAISLNDDPAHYGRENSVAHCMADGEICLSYSGLWAARVIWHEAGHAYHFSLRHSDPLGLRCLAFTIRWFLIAGMVYDAPSEGQTFPANGLLTAYSTSNVFEDVAEFVEACYSYKAGRMDSILIRMKASGELQKDPRYAKKIKLLAKYGFISKQLRDEILK